MTNHSTLSVPAGTLLSARALTREFTVGGQKVAAVHGINIDIFPGEFVALLGRSGSGKTTLLNLLGGLDRPSSGAVYLEGKDLSAFTEQEMASLRRNKLGFIFQSFGLLPLLSAQENIDLPLRIAGVSRGERDRMTKEALETVGLSRRAKHRPYELSGGEQQRVAIARAIAHHPPLILADEPTAELDSVTAKTIFTLLATVIANEGITVLVATHDRMVLDVAHRVIALEDGTLAKTPAPAR